MFSIGRQTWFRLLRVARPFFLSEARGKAFGLLGVLLALLLTLSGLNVVNSYVGRDFMTAIAERAAGRYAWLALLYLGVFAASTIAGALSRYTELLLGLRWREWLTQHFIRSYLSGHAYYRVNLNQDVDNPDQRISEDVRTFTTTSLSFLIILLSSAITAVAFSGVLWSISPWLFLVSILYPAVGTCLAILIGRRLVTLNNLQLKKEADFRYELVHVREHADSLALAHREHKEDASLGARLGALVDNYQAIIRVLRNLKFFSGGYNFLTQLIPVLIAAPLYMRGEVEFGVITQALMAFSQVFNAFSLVVEQFQDISTYSAVVTRLAVLMEAIDRPAVEEQSSIQIVEKDEHVAFEHLTLRTPTDNRVLIRALSLEVRRGQRLLITGSNGVGKTALFRATAGVWQGGSGKIVRPPWKQIVFLPQRPFLISGLLRDQLLDVPSQSDGQDDRLLEVLQIVRLGPVVARVGGLNAEHDWANALSLGEQQLLAFARLLLLRPAFAFLDHAASAVGETARESIYERLTQNSISYISVGSKHPSMLKHHDLLLEIQENGEWTTEPIQAALQT